jgi:hypothetical protein
MNNIKEELIGYVSRISDKIMNIDIDIDNSKKHIGSVEIN